MPHEPRLVLCDHALPERLSLVEQVGDLRHQIDYDLGLRLEARDALL